LAVDENGFLQISPDSTGYDQSEQVFKVATYVWDTDLLQWVRGTQGATTGSGGVSAPAVRIKRFDIQSSVIYLGEAPPGTASSSPAWRIRRIALDAQGNPTSSLLAGSGSATNVWDARASLSYT
jgi:hypothetical protein